MDQDALGEGVGLVLEDGIAIIGDEFAAQEQRPKRPRVGRPHTEILGNIDSDSATVPGWPRHLRGLLLHVGEGKEKDSSDEPAPAALKRQSHDMLSIVRGHGDAAINIVFEA